MQHNFWLHSCLLENVGFLHGINNVIICSQAAEKLSKSKTVVANLIT